jgi:Uma2 family endonuclease
MTTTVPALATIADLELHPGRCELIEGEIIDMAPAGFEHGRAMARIGYLLARHVEAQRLPGAVLVGDPGFILDDHNVRAPDVAYLDAERCAQAPKRGFMRFVPNLAVEVVSPGDSYSDTVAKARLWISQGVSLVWVADPHSQTVEVYAQGQPVRQLEVGDRIDGGMVLPGFACTVGELFA